MAGKPGMHLVDGRWTTILETAELLGVTPQQIYNQIHHKRCGLQAVVNMIRENLVLNGQGYTAHRFMVDGRWMTVRQASEMLGVPASALHHWRYNHRDAQGRPATLADAVEAYRENRVKHGGSERVQHRVGNKTVTVFDAAEKLGVSVNAIRLHMYRHKVGLAATIRYYEQRKLKKAEKNILAILRGN